MSQSIPSPPGIPFVGNINDVDRETPMLSFVNLSERYGEIFKLKVFGKERVVCATQELVNEICDEKRFDKAKSQIIGQLRFGVHDGLFTAYPGEHNWEIAHRVLMPAFGPLKIKAMFGELHDLASQLVLKWARHGSNEVINVGDDFTRLTLDSIALCGMGIRFNSFYREGLHPFVQAMYDFFTEAGLRASRPAIQQYFMSGSQRKFDDSIKVMRDIAKELIDERRKNPTDKQDLLNAMLFGKDPKTGERMTDESIMNNMITFLIAGHETTSGMLAFAIYQLINNPSALRKAQEEVDHVVGKGAVLPEHTAKLQYIQACLRETLRATPSIPAFAMQMRDDGPEETTIGGGRYRITKDMMLVVNIPSLHRDPAVWGADAADFKPERMMQDKFDALPRNCWKPFGNGVRHCIGRPFAWEEAVLALALLLQNFTFRLANPSYELRIKQTLTIKPDGLLIYATLRKGVDLMQLEKKLVGGDTSSTSEYEHLSCREVKEMTKKPMSIFFGSNAGTCESLANTLASAASGHGFEASVSPLDTAPKPLLTGQPTAIITASYEGLPTDNAAQFVEWLKHAEKSELIGVNYAVFGCGHKDWASTYQQVPALVDDLMKSGGASQIVKRGATDVSAGAVFDDFDRWQDEHFWPALGSKTSELSDYGGLEVTLNTSSQASALNAQVQDAMVLEVGSLTGPGIPEKRHISFQLPSNMTYECGDYMSVLPINNVRTINRVFKRFSLPWDTYMTIAPGSHTTLPTGESTSVVTILGAHVELNAPATRKHIHTLSKFASNEVTKSLVEMTAETNKQVSVLSILESYPDIEVHFGFFLSMLPAMRIRQYSISSSPLVDPNVAALTYAVVQSLSGKHPEASTFLGVTTNHLASLQPGSRAQIAVKKSHASFHPPNMASTPIIMICAGTGLAPFRGFVQHRACIIQAGQTNIGPALLFIGCTYYEKDTLYKEELHKYAELGAVRIFYAFSKEPEKSAGVKHVQERVWHERGEVSKLFDEGAQVYVCGASRLGEGVKEVAIKIYMEKSEAKRWGKTEKDAEEWFEGLRYERYASDVFS
jgi:cytochrome P450/NADPH-cytochrome P450 reductase